VKRVGEKRVEMEIVEGGSREGGSREGVDRGGGGGRESEYRIIERACGYGHYR